MEAFIDREAVLKHIEDALAALGDKKSLLRTPIIDFYGVVGIGKTFFLKKVQKRCQEQNLRCIWIDALQNNHDILHEFVRQVQNYSIGQSFEINDANILYESISATRVLLQHGPVVFLCDAIDTSNREQLKWLERLLHDLSDDNNLFAVLTSKRALSFENDRVLARKLTLIHMQPFDRSACEAYLNAASHQSEQETHATIFIWTRGYPLALSVMRQAIVDGLDPRKERDQQEIITRLTDQVLHQNVLGRVNPAERDRYQTILILLSVPRHFNLILMQDLIESFTPHLKRENSLAYFGFPREINQATDVLNWNSNGTGFSVDMPVRTIFLLKLKVEQPERFDAIHRFLAQKNRQWAVDVTGNDRVRYLCEYLYHEISSRDATTLASFLTTAVQEIADAFPESAAQFADGVVQDEELKEILGIHLHSIELLK